MSTLQDNILKSSAYGIARELVVQPVLYPLEVIKIRHQNSSQTACQIARRMHDEGIGSFYKGFVPQMTKVFMKPLWRFPLMTEIPKALPTLDPFQQQAIAGLTIATTDALITTPLEKMKIQSAVSGVSCSSRPINKEAWSGFSAYWFKLAANWVTFLVAQKYVREKISPNKPLSFSQTIVAGVSVALIVSVVAAPFDMMNTLAQTNNNQKLKCTMFYRGWSLSVLSLLIHNIASVYMLDRLTHTARD